MYIDENSIIEGVRPEMLIRPALTRNEKESQAIKSLLYATKEKRSDDSKLLCPRCADTNVSPVAVEISSSNEYKPSKTLRVDMKCETKKVDTYLHKSIGQGASLGIIFICEQGHQSILSMGFYKGETYASLESFEIVDTS